MNFNINKIRQDFPILRQKVYNKSLIYFDNGATSQKPQQVIDVLNDYYLKHNSNIHRGVHFLSEKTTQAYETARKTIKNFINADNDYEIIFTAGTTASINLVAYSFAEKFLFEDDEIIISEMEHHSNIVPWQIACERKKAKLKIIPFNNNGELILDEYKKLITQKTKLIAVNHISNSLGTINPIKEIIKIAHSNNIPVLIDGAQGIQHQKVDVKDLDCDFYCFSGHKVYGPTGIGVLYGKQKWLDALPPYQGGGDMIKSVSFEKTVYNDLPFKFEAGTTNYIGAIGLGQAIKYIDNIGIDEIIKHDKKLIDYAHKKLLEIPEITIYGQAEKKSSIISFLINGIHHFDTGMLLDKMDIAVRTGTHCTMPLMKHYGIEGTVRASFGIYNTCDEIDILYNAINKIIKMFKK